MHVDTRIGTDLFYEEGVRTWARMMDRVKCSHRTKRLPMTTSLKIRMKRAWCLPERRLSLFVTDVRILEMRLPQFGTVRFIFTICISVLLNKAIGIIRLIQHAHVNC
ncbi:hypothetical protein D3C73_1069450 [compost metagenome]